MATYTTKITKRYTIDQFCSMNKTRGFRLMKVLTKNKETGEVSPLYHDGTDIQKCTVINDAGDTIAWASKSLCQDVLSGKFDSSRNLAFIQSEGVCNETGEPVCFFTLSYPGVDQSRVIDILSM